MRPALTWAIGLITGMAEEVGFINAPAFTWAIGLITEMAEGGGCKAKALTETNLPQLREEKENKEIIG